MITNVYPKYEPKTDWENQTKVNMNIRDLQGKYPNGCQCCGNIYTKDKFSILVNSHFKTKKHQKLCMEPANATFENDFRCVNDINTAYEESCRENRQLKRLNYELFQKIKNLEEQLNIYKFPGNTNLIDLI